MRQEHVEAFLEIVKTKNIKKAADHLHLSQSAVSQYLKQLEESLNLQLVIRHRGCRGVELTNYGEEFVPLAENWIALVHRMEALQRNPKLELTVGSVDSLNANILYPVCKNLLSTHPDMNIHIRTAQSDHLYEMAMNGEIDIGFVGYEMTKPHVVSAYAFSQKVCVVRTKAEDDSSVVTSPADLPEEREISLNWSPEYHVWHDRYWNTHIHPHISTDAMLLLRCFMNTAGCWSVMPEIDLADLQQGHFEVCDLGDANPPDRKIFQILPQRIGPNRSPALELFRNTLAQYVDSNPFLYR